MGAKNKSTEDARVVKVTTASNAVVVGATKKRPVKRWLALVVVVLAIVAIIVLVIGKNRNADMVKAGDQKYQTTLQQAEQLSSNGDEPQKARKLEAYLATNPPKEQQTVPTQQLASAYLNSGEYQKAVDTFGKLAELDPQFAISAYQGQAGAYAKLGNKQAAIAAHKKVISLYKAMGEDQFNARIIMENQEIARLQGTDQ